MRAYLLIFVDDLQIFHRENTALFEDKQLFLLRNQSRKGIGFFENEGFYPDFLLWLLVGDKQYITFIDPKGLRQITGFEHPKMSFYKTVKEKIEDRLDDKDVILNSFIVSSTPYQQVTHWKGQNKLEDFHKRNVYFQSRDYVEEIIKKILSIEN